MLTRGERLLIFASRLLDAPAARDAGGAKTLLDAILNAVEDEFSGVAYDPGGASDDGRMYPAQDDNRRLLPNRPDLIRYRHRGHETVIGENGAILIRSIAASRVIVDKPGRNGARIKL